MDVKNWIMQIVTTAMLGGIADALTKKSRQNMPVRLCASVMLVFVIVSPIRTLEPELLRSRWGKLLDSAQTCTVAGDELRDRLTGEEICRSLETLVVHKAGTMGVSCRAQVSLDESCSPREVIVIHDGSCEPRTLQALSDAVAALFVTDGTEVVISFETAA